MDHVLWMEGMLFNIWMEEVVKVQVVILITSYIKLNTDRKYKGINIQGVSRLVDITAGVEFLGLCDQKSSYKHVSDFGWLRSYDRLNLRIEGNDY